MCAKLGIFAWKTKNFSVFLPLFLGNKNTGWVKITQPVYKVWKQNLKQALFTPVC